MLSKLISEHITIGELKLTTLVTYSSKEFSFHNRQPSKYVFNLTVSPFDILLNVYNSLVQPHFDYCSVVWGNCSKNLSSKLQKLQNRAARVLTFSNYDCSTSELFQNLKWSKLVHQRAVSKAIMMHSIVNNTAPEYLTSRFVRRCDLTSYNLRENEYKLAVPQPRTEFYKRSLSYSGSVLWNGLPLEVRQLTSPSIFKGKLIDINFD